MAEYFKFMLLVAMVIIILAHDKFMEDMFKLEADKMKEQVIVNNYEGTPVILMEKTFKNN